MMLLRERRGVVQYSGFTNSILCYVSMKAEYISQCLPINIINRTFTMSIILAFRGLLFKNQKHLKIKILHKNKTTVARCARQA